MKFRQDVADISQDMDQTEPGKVSPTTSKADLTREKIIASDAASIADWVEALVHAIAARRAQPLDNSSLEKIDSDLEAATRSCLNQVGDITLRVEKFDLLFEGHCVYHNATRADSLPIALHRDGLFEIFVGIGLESDELSAFVDILERVTAASDQDSEDVVTLLWEGSFRHIGYSCVPPEEWEPESSGEGRESGNGSDDCGIPWPAEATVEETGSDEGGPFPGRSDDWSLLVDGTPTSSEVHPAQFDLSDIETNNICMLASVEGALSPRDRILDVLLAVLAGEERPAEFLEIALSLGRLVEQVAAEGNMEGAKHLVDQLRAITNSKTITPSEFESARNQVLKRLGRGEFLSRIAAIPSLRREVDLKAFTQFLAQLGPAAAPALCDILGEIAEMKIRRAVCEALVISCKNHVGILIDRLSDSRWYVVRNILYVLGRIAHQGVERALGDTLSHSDIRVRREAIRALAEIESPTSRAYLNSALRDSDKSIRVLVARLLARRKDERAARIIWSVIESPEFVARDVDERVAFCEALGRSGSDALIPKVERMLTRGGLFQSTSQAGRMEAAMALAWLGTPAALDILSREEQSKYDAIRRAVTDALATIRQFSREGQKKG